jgi:hypothetical protein
MLTGFQSMEFESADASIVKSIRQRDLLNCWLRLRVSRPALPALTAYRPERLEDEFADLVYYAVDRQSQPPRLLIESNGTRMSRAYGTTGRGRYLDDYLGPILGPVVLPAYHACLAHGLPIYTVSMIDDVNGRVVAYERMLLPFSEGFCDEVTHIVASLKTISEDGGFEIQNLMRGHHSLPKPKLSVVIDRGLSPRLPNRVESGDIVEIGQASQTSAHRPPA